MCLCEKWILDDVWSIITSNNAHLVRLSSALLLFSHKFARAFTGVESKSECPEVRALARSRSLSFEGDSRLRALSVSSGGKSSESVQSTYWRPVTHAQTWASYSALYRFGNLSHLDFCVILLQCVRLLCS